MWALAIWDASRRRLFLARDRLGVKPLVYAQTADGFVFGSEIKALIASGLVARELDIAALPHYLSSFTVPEPQTLVRGVRRLPAGHTLTVDGDGRHRADVLGLRARGGGGSGRRRLPRGGRGSPRRRGEPATGQRRSARGAAVQRRGLAPAGGVRSSGIGPQAPDVHARFRRDRSRRARRSARHRGANSAQITTSSCWKGTRAFTPCRTCSWRTTSPVSHSSRTTSSRRFARTGVTVALSGIGGRRAVCRVPDARRRHGHEPLRCAPEPAASSGDRDGAS